MKREIWTLLILSVLVTIPLSLVILNNNFTIIFGQSDQNTIQILDAFAQNEETKNNNELKLDSLVADGAPTLGNLNAPVTIIDFSDFQCYMCKRYVQSTEPIINEKYIESGKVNLIFKHFPIRGFDSKGASLAAQCTNDQDKFWEFHSLLYNNQGPIDSGWVNTENLKNFALQIEGLDVDEFTTCFDNKKYKDYIEKDLELAKKFKFKESPSFIIVNNDGTNPEFLSGAHPFPSFSSIIDKKLENLQ